jgi:peptidoglycan/LPS O-acetylase OafA/YrhL
MLGAILALAACSVVFSIHAASMLLCWAFGALMVLALDVPRKGRLFMLGLALVAAGVAFLQLSVGSRFLATRALAAVSYTLYLIHYPVNLALDHVFTKASEITAQSLAIFLARITICVAASLLFYFFFERHTQEVRHWLKGT